jgi:hypothetical protein
MPITTPAQSFHAAKHEHSAQSQPVANNAQTTMPANSGWRPKKKPVQDRISATKHNIEQRTNETGDDDHSEIQKLNPTNIEPPRGTKAAKWLPVHVSGNLGSLGAVCGLFGTRFETGQQSS